MLELGAEAPALHSGLKEAVDAAGVDLVFASGADMAHLFQALSDSQKGAWAESSAGLMDTLLAVLKPGDVVMIKGSFGSRMGPLAEALRSVSRRVEIQAVEALRRTGGASQEGMGCCTS